MCAYFLKIRTFSCWVQEHCFGRCMFPDLTFIYLYTAVLPTSLNRYIVYQIQFSQCTVPVIVLIHRIQHCHCYLQNHYIFCMGRYSAVGTGWTVLGGSNPGGGEIFRTGLDRSWGLLRDAYRVFPGGKASGAIPLLTLGAFVSCSRANFYYIFCNLNSRYQLVYFFENFWDQQVNNF
jgi:hypothetical protein